MVDPPERVSAADAGRGGSQPAQEATAILRVAVPPVQEEDAAGSPQPGAGPAARGTAAPHTVETRGRWYNVLY